MLIRRVALLDDRGLRCHAYFPILKDDVTVFLARVAEPPNSPVIMSTSTFTSLASLVSFPKRMQRWDKLEDDDKLVKLHTKFWGKGMVQEDESSQTSDLGKRENLDIDESMEVDTSENIEDDAKNGYVLVLDNKAFRHERIWVRVSAYTGRNWHCIHELGRPTISGSTTSS